MPDEDDKLESPLRTRHNYSVPHLLLASRLAREVDSTEKQNQGADFGPFFDIVLGASVGCVIASVAALESYANEVFADRASNFSSTRKELVDLLWNEFEPKSLLDKFDLALQLKGSSPLDRGVRHVQAIDRLIQLRNGLVHFKPEWFGEQPNHSRLSARLEGYVSRSPWLMNEPLFPRAWATSRTTAWCLESVKSFISDFSRNAGLQDRLLQFHDRLQPTTQQAAGT